MKHFVRAAGKVAYVVKERKDSDGTLALNELAHNDIVKKLDRRPIDALLDILFLLFLERQLDENLLQFLVDKVDTCVEEMVGEENTRN